MNHRDNWFSKVRQQITSLTDLMQNVRKKKNSEACTGDDKMLEQIIHILHRIWNSLSWEGITNHTKHSFRKHALVNSYSKLPVRVFRIENKKKKERQLLIIVEFEIALQVLMVQQPWFCNSTLSKLHLLKVYLLSSTLYCQWGKNHFTITYCFQDKFKATWSNFTFYRLANISSFTSIIKLISTIKL